MHQRRSLELPIGSITGIMDFRPHGDRSLYYQQSGIVIAEPLGCWNKEAAQHYCADVRSYISQSASIPPRWCRVIDLSQYQLHTPDVPSRLRRLAFWMTRHGCIFHSYIFSNALQAQAVDEIFKSVAAPYDSADHREEALEQCQQALAEEGR